MKKYLCVLSILLFAVLLAGSAYAFCGDGVIDAGNDCDIGLDRIPGTSDDVDDACLANEFCVYCRCKGTTICGNGIIEPGESCDEGSVIPISTCEELEAIPNNFDGHYVLTNDIDCSATSGWDEGKGFEPIELDGSFDGRWHDITGLFINRPNEVYIALFLNTNLDSVIKNVNLVNCQITGGSSVAGLVAHNRGTIVNCSSSGSVNHDSSGVAGGLVAGSTYGLILNSYSTVNVNEPQNPFFSSWFPGGFIGQNRFGLIINSYSRGSVVGREVTGGFASQNSYGNIINSYSTGSVTGHDRVGGFLGQSTGASCSGDFWNPTDAAPTITNISGCGTESTQDNMKQQATYIAQGWDFADVWAISPAKNNGYPYLQMETGICSNGNCDQSEDSSNCPSDCSVLPDVCLPADSCVACRCVSPGCLSLTAVPDVGIGPFTSALTASFENVVDGTLIDFDCDGDSVVDGTVLVSGDSASFDCGYLAVVAVTNYAASAIEPVSGASCITNVTVNPPATPSCLSLTAVPDVGIGPFTSALTASFENVVDGTLIDFDCDGDGSAEGQVALGADSASFDCDYPAVVVSTSFTASASGGSVSCTANVTVIPPAVPGTAEFQIVSFELDPNPVTEAFPVTVTALVEVVNLGAGSPNCVVDITVKDLSGVSKATDAVAVTQSVGSSPALSTIPFTVGADWVPGNYEVIATASKPAAAVPDSKKIVYLNVLGAPGTAAVPELSLLVIPLLLAIVLFVLKKK